MRVAAGNSYQKQAPERPAGTLAPDYRTGSPLDEARGRYRVRQVLTAQASPQSAAIKIAHPI